MNSKQLDERYELESWANQLTLFGTDLKNIPKFNIDSSAGLFGYTMHLYLSKMELQLFHVCVKLLSVGIKKKHCHTSAWKHVDTLLDKTGTMKYIILQQIIVLLYSDLI